MMQRALLLITGLLIMLLGVSPSIAAGDTPPLPAAYYGSVTYDDGSPVQTGTIEAVIDGSICGSIGISNGFYGSQNSGEPKLIVQYPEAVPGKIIHFIVNGVEAGQSVEWQSQAMCRLDLVVSKASFPKPVVTTKAPTGGNETKYAAVSATFNMAVKLVQSSGISIADSAGTPVNITSVYLNNNTLNIGHENFDYSKTYTVTVSANSVQSSVYNTYNDAISWSFTTAAEPPVETGGTVTGKLTLDGLSTGALGGVIIEIKDSTGSVVKSGASNSDGSYSVLNVPAGTYTLWFSAPKYLKKKVVNITVEDGGTTQVLDVKLRVGDVYPDNKINLTDLVTLAKSYNKQLGQTGYNEKCDFSGDNKVTLTDLVLMAKAYNLTGDN